jgi:hypothetical protein
MTAMTAAIAIEETDVVVPGPLTEHLVVITKSTHTPQAASIESANVRQFMIDGKDAVMEIGPGTVTALRDGTPDATMRIALVVVSVTLSRIVVQAEAVEAVVSVIGNLADGIGGEARVLLSSVANRLRT